jgi:hypothetical protein
LNQNKFALLSMARFAQNNKTQRQKDLPSEKNMHSSSAETLPHQLYNKVWFNLPPVTCP